MTVASVLLVLVGVVLGPVRAAAQETPVDLAGPCAGCHAPIASQLWSSGGHGTGLRCVECHAERQRVIFGPRHRAIPRCKDCHDEAVHPVRHGRLRTGPTKRCLGCHDPHGTPNASLVMPALRRPGPRLVPVHFDGTDFVDPAQPGRGVCEVCHRHTDVYRADGQGAPHYTEPCDRCHDHRLGFAPVATADNCAICHAGPAADLAKPSQHHDRFTCTDCHAEVSPTPGDGHRRVPACTDCHTMPATHAPPGMDPFACGQCHNAHGSDNLSLVRATILRGDGAPQPITFTNRDGLADGSYASVSAPGTGVCETCHTTTRFYRADGTGAPHFDLPCFPCHRHDEGFAP